MRAFDTDLPTRHSGATGIAGAARARRRAENRLRGGLWLLRDLPVRGLGILFGDLPGPLAATIYLVTQGERMAPYFLGPTVVVLLAAPLRGAIEPSLRIWLYGAEVRAQQRVRLRTLLTAVALPTLGVTFVGVLFVGPAPIRDGFLAAVVAAVLLRAGADALWHLGASPFRRPIASVAILSPAAAAVMTG